MLNLVKRPIGLDDIAEVRYLHSSAFQMCGAEHHTNEEIQAYISRINSVEYIRECLNCSLYGLWHNHILVGTSGWNASGQTGSTAHHKTGDHMTSGHKLANLPTARMRKIFIHNFYLGLGLGREMAENAEKRATDAGFHQFSVRTNISAASFFKAIGYKTSSAGCMNTPNGTDIPITYMRKIKPTLAKLHPQFGLSKTHHQEPTYLVRG